VEQYAIYIQQLRDMNVPQSEWPDNRWNVDPFDYLRPVVFDASTPDATTHEGRRAQLRHFDQFPYAEDVRGRGGAQATPAAPAVSSELADDVCF
jgi:hypothetical protein